MALPDESIHLSARGMGYKYRFVQALKRLW